MMIVPMPVFDEDMSVEAYWLSSHDGKKMLGVKDNFLRLDDAFTHPGLRMVAEIGLEPYTGEKPLFAEISHIQLMSGMFERVKIDPEKLVCVIPAESLHNEEAAGHIRKLREMGYRIALDNFPSHPDAPAIRFVDFVVLDYTDPRYRSQSELMSRMLRTKRAVVRNIPDMETFISMRQGNGTLFSGSFYARPITRKKTQMSPIKVNALKLLNEVNQDDFELDVIVKTIERDPYLSVSLLKFLNSSASGLKNQVDSIQQAVTILGQIAVRQWAMVALSATLGNDRPNEITRLSLIRAKFAENVSLAFDLGVWQQSLFIAGLFSLLDVMLERPMAEAINEVAVSSHVKNVLVYKQGPLAPVMELIYAYEHADWDRVSILMIQNNTDMERIGQAYLNALVWYRKLLQSIDDTVQ